MQSEKHIKDLGGHMSNLPPFDPMTSRPSFPASGTGGHDIEPGFLRFGGIPTVQNVKDNYLFGIPLRSALTKQDLPDSTIQDSIIKAISEIEHSIKLFISPVTIKQERHNYAWNEFYFAFGFLTLNHRPILEVQKLEVSIPSSTDVENLVEWPTQWLKVYNEFGTLQLVPLTGSGSVLVTQVSGGASFPVRLFNANNFPQFWAVTYRVGMEVDKIPYAIRELIEVISALNILSMLSPIIFPYNSYGISMDGLSQSVSTPGPQWFAARIQTLTDRKQELMGAIRSYYSLNYSLDVLG